MPVEFDDRAGTVTVGGTAHACRALPGGGFELRGVRLSPPTAAGRAAAVARALSAPDPEAAVCAALRGACGADPGDDAIVDAVVLWLSGADVDGLSFADALAVLLRAGADVASVVALPARDFDALVDVVGGGGADDGWQTIEFAAPAPSQERASWVLRLLRRGRPEFVPEPRDRSIDPRGGGQVTDGATATAHAGAAGDDTAGVPGGEAARRRAASAAAGPDTSAGLRGAAGAAAVAHARASGAGPAAALTAGTIGGAAGGAAGTSGGAASVAQGHAAGGGAAGALTAAASGGAADPSGGAAAAGGGTAGASGGAASVAHGSAAGAGPAEALATAATRDAAAGAADAHDRAAGAHTASALARAAAGGALASRGPVHGHSPLGDPPSRGVARTSPAADPIACGHGDPASGDAATGTGRDWPRGSGPAAVGPAPQASRPAGRGASTPIVLAGAAMGVHLVASDDVPAGFGRHAPAPAAVPRADAAAPNRLAIPAPALEDGQWPHTVIGLGGARRRPVEPTPAADVGDLGAALGAALDEEADLRGLAR